MRIGLLSDTHGYLDEAILAFFQSCDEIWHAGDIGSVEIVERLQALKPLRAVFGNIDDLTIRARFPEDQFFTCEGVHVFITHIGGRPGRYEPRVRKLFPTKKPDLFICGHSHILRAQKDPDYHFLYINPGAAGNQGMHNMRTVVRFEIVKKEVKLPEVIELGRRGAL